MKIHQYVFLFGVLLTSLVISQPNPNYSMHRIVGSGGPIIREQSAYDILFYKLNIEIDPDKKSITGSVLIKASLLDTLSNFVLDLNNTLTVDAIYWRGRYLQGSALKFSRPSGKIWISLPSIMTRQDTIMVEVSYHGSPKISQNPPWDDGFIWSKTKTEEVWAGVACEEEGADMWWPCKDHPSDEPDSVDLYFTVPSALICVLNGRQREVTERGTKKTFHWFVSEPINNYNITFYLGPYQKIPIAYQSVTGEMIPSEYWFLPYDVEKANQYSSIFLKDIRFFEEVCGPFPFRKEKYGLVEAPYWGMEHQTAIAYGNNFALNSYGFDLYTFMNWRGEILLQQKTGAIFGFTKDSLLIWNRYL
jgi:aminopeptidase N